MSIDKFKQLHDLVINEDTDAARELFHEIVLEKSRTIFESMMHDEEDMDEGMGGQVGDMLDEISAEESGMMEDDDDTDIDFGDEEDGMDDLGDVEDMDDESEEHEEIEDAVIRIEDKLDQLMAEFEEIMGSEEGAEEDFDSEEDFGDEEEDFDSEEDFGDEEEDFGDEDEEAMMENVQLQKVSVTHGDNGSNTKNPVAFNSGQAGMASKPVKFSGDTESVPTSPKGPSNSYTKGETSVKHSSEWKNVPGKKSQDLSAAPKAKAGDDGVNKRSPVAESRKPVRKTR